MRKNLNLENSMLQYEKRSWVPVYFWRLFRVKRERTDKNQQLCNNSFGQNLQLCFICFARIMSTQFLSLRKVRDAEVPIESRAAEAYKFRD